MDVTTIDDLAKAAQALLLFVFSFVLVGLITGAAVDAIGPKGSADGSPAKGFYRRKYAAVGGLLALAVFAIGTVVYADPKPLDAAAVVTAVASLFFAICLIFEKLPFHSNRVVAPVEPAPVDDGVRTLTPPTIGLMSHEPAGRGLRNVAPVAEAPAPTTAAPPVEPEPVGVVEPEIEPGLEEPASSDLIAQSPEPELETDDPEAGSGLAGSAFASDPELVPEPDEPRPTVPVGLADVEPTEPVAPDAETPEIEAAGAEPGEAADDAEALGEPEPSGKKSKKGKKKKKKK